MKKVTPNDAYASNKLTKESSFGKNNLLKTSAATVPYRKKS
jgi:hypothetical protein